MNESILKISDQIRNLPVDDVPVETAEARKCLNESMQEARLGGHLRDCGVPPRAVEIITSAAKLKATDAVSACRAWAKSGASFLVLTGPAGCGKTVAAGACLKMARAGRYYMGDDGQIVASWSYSSKGGMFVRSAELSSMAPWAQEGRGKWTCVREVPWLVLDDLGMERMDNAGVWAEQLDLLVDIRYQDSLRTVITTNLDKSGLERRYGARIMRRLTEAGTIAECKAGGA